MTRTTLVSLIGIGVALILAVSCVVSGLAVRAGLADEVLVWFPPQARYQMIVRIGRDAAPWSFNGHQPPAINVWLHDRDQERWHLASVVHVPLGREPFRETAAP